MTTQSNMNLVKARFLADLALIQQDTAPITLQIGATFSGTVSNSFIVIKDAPQKAVEGATDLAKKYGLTFSLGPLGLYVGFDLAREMSREEFFK